MTRKTGDTNYNPKELNLLADINVLKAKNQMLRIKIRIKDQIIKKLR